MVYNITFFAGLHYTGVGLGTAIAIGSSPLWAGLLQAAVQRNRLQRLWWLGSCVSVLGGFLMAWGKAPHLTAPWLGIALCLLAGLAYGAYAVISQPLLLGCGIARVNAWVFACAACMAVPIAVLLGGLPSIDAQSGLVVLYLGMIATGLAYLLFSIGLRSVSAATCVALSKLEPITAFALSIYIVGEAPSGLALSGLVIVLAGLWMVILSEMRHSKAVEVR